MRQTRCLLGLQLPGDLTESGGPASMLTQLLVGYWLEASVPRYMGLSAGLPSLLRSWHLASPRVGDPRENKAESMMLYDVASELSSLCTHHHLCCILLVKTNLNAMQEGTNKGYKYQELAYDNQSNFLL